jgi:hypothetical protein
VSEPAFVNFLEWAGRYRNHPTSTGKQGLEAEGRELASIRRNELAALIQTDPRRALEVAVTRELRDALPDSIQPLLEQSVSGRGDLDVLAALPEPGVEMKTPPISRSASINGEFYRAFVYGRRNEQPTLENVPLHGIAVDALLAVSENPVRLMSAYEAELAHAAHPDPLCSVSGSSALAHGDLLAAEVAGEPVFLCGSGHAEALNEQWITAEEEAVSRSIGLSATSSRTLGIKKLIFIRVDFSDLTGDPFSNSTGTNLVSGLDRFYMEGSYGRTGFAPLGAGSSVTPTLRMPRTAAYYGANDATRLRSDARAAAADAGYTLSSYDYDLTCFGSVPGFDWAGLGRIGASGAWIRSSFSTSVPAHELGHNFGLNHARFWDTAGQSVIGAGTSVEYGDKFDIMGSGGSAEGHFNVRYKQLIGWLPGFDVTTFGTNGTFRIYAQDSADEVAGARALKVSKNSSTNYWVEFRQRYTSLPRIMDGALLRLAGPGTQATRLLDTTPGSPDGKNDAAIVIGRTFSDTVSHIHITPIGKGGTSPESLNVVVNKGPFLTNVAPTLTLSADRDSVGIRVDVTFQAAAMDANGDTLAYAWEFGDGGYSIENSPTATHRWTATGYYVVRCVVSDMKGGTASDSVLVRVGSPNTFNISGHVQRESGPLEGARVSVSTTRVAYTDSDGGYILAGLPRGNYTVKASNEDTLFTALGFSNPINLSAHRSDVSFLAALPGDLSTLAIVAQGAVWKYLDDGSDPGTAWREPGFDDSRWNSGPARLGYGDNDLATEISFGPSSNNKYAAAYFRHAFEIGDPRQFSSLNLGLLRDDGGIVYLNGREVFRSNMPVGTVTSRTRASATVSGADESTFFETTVDPAMLVPGRNILAIEVHQVSATSSDLRFNLELIAVGQIQSSPPALTWVLSAGAFRVSWPATAAGYLLEQSDSLESDAVWETVSSPISTAGGQKSVVIQAVETQQFFRLAKP